VAKMVFFEKGRLCPTNTGLCAVPYGIMAQWPVPVCFYERWSWSWQHGYGNQASIPEKLRDENKIRNYNERLQLQ